MRSSCVNSSQCWYIPRHVQYGTIPIVHLVWSATLYLTGIWSWSCWRIISNPRFPWYITGISVVYQWYISSISLSTMSPSLLKHGELRKSAIFAYNNLASCISYIGQIQILKTCTIVLYHQLMTPSWLNGHLAINIDNTP